MAAMNGPSQVDDDGDGARSSAGRGADASGPAKGAARDSDADAESHLVNKALDEEEVEEARRKTGMSIIELDIRELERACEHLERSNSELREFLAESGPDRDFELAIEENEDALGVKRQRIADLRAILDRAARGLPAPMPTFLESDPATKGKIPVLLQHTERKPPPVPAPASESDEPRVEPDTSKLAAETAREPAEQDPALSEAGSGETADAKEPRSSETQEQQAGDAQEPEHGVFL